MPRVKCDDEKSIRKKKKKSFLQSMGDKNEAPEKEKKKTEERVVRGRKGRTERRELSGKFSEALGAKLAQAEVKSHTSPLNDEKIFDSLPPLPPTFSSSIFLLTLQNF